VSLPDPHHCITCSDEGREMVVRAVDRDRWIALCEDDDGTRSSVEVALVDCAPGDTLLVHAGTALFNVTGDGLARPDAELPVRTRVRMTRGGDPT
jgi:hypothetical protein